VYKVSEEKSTYKQAEWACQAWQGTLWDSLSSMENQGEADYVSQLLTADGYWFGLQKKLGSWSWNDGKKISFSKQHRYTNCMQL